MEGGGDELGGRGGIFVKLWMYKLTFNRFNELVRNFPYVVKRIWVVSILLLQRERWGRTVEDRRQQFHCTKRTHYTRVHTISTKE